MDIYQSPDPHQEPAANATFSVKLLYFASLGEQLGCREEVVALPMDVTSVQQLTAYLAGRGDQWLALAGAEVKCAVNQSIAREFTPVNDGDEVAFFPPVTGG